MKTALVYPLASRVWMGLVEKTTPDRWNLIGGGPRPQLAASGRANTQDDKAQD